MDLTTKIKLTLRSSSLLLWATLYVILSFLINLGLGYPPSLIYSLAFGCTLLLLWAWAPRLQKALILFWGLLSALYLPFALTYGAPNFNTLLALHSTTLLESSEMVTQFPWYSYLLSVFILSLTFIAGRRKIIPIKQQRHLTWLYLTAVILGLFFTPTTHLIDGGTFSMRDIGYPVVRFVKDVFVSNSDVLDEQRRMHSLAQQKDAWHLDAVHAKYQIYVVVIGESARRDALGAFGGSWQNTPFLSQAKGYLLTDYISASASTQKSLGLTLNRVLHGKPLYQDNFITLANRAGFQTWWFSNQGQIGQYDTVIASIAKRADEAHFLKSGNFEADKNSQDIDLLKMTAQVLAVPHNVPQLIVLHLMGSHPKACDRTQGHYQLFVRSEETSCYLESIRQTDDLLSQLYTQLKASGESFSLVYFSDHGMTFKERGSRNEYLTHDDKYKQNFQVPFAVLSSDDTQHNVIKARRSANDFLTFFADWTGIKTAMLPNKYRFLSEQAAPPAYVTDFTLTPVNYADLQEQSFNP